MRKLPQAIILSTVFWLAGCAGSGGEEPQPTASRSGAGFTPPGGGDDRDDGQAVRSNGVVTLSWNPPTENADGSTMSDLAGYRIYYGKTPHRLDQTIVIDNPGLTRYVIENLDSAKWHFAMTAVNLMGKESERSRTVSKRIG